MYSGEVRILLAFILLREPSRSLTFYLPPRPLEEPHRKQPELNRQQRHRRARVPCVGSRTSIGRCFCRKRALLLQPSSHNQHSNDCIPHCLVVLDVIAASEGAIAGII